MIVADDQEAVRRGLEALLEAYGDIEVVAKAGDGAEAVRLAENLHPDLVLMDCRMPNFDGFEATRMLKELSPEIAVLSLSMYADLREQALAAGADSFVVKGAPGSHLVEEIYRTVDNTRQVERRHR